MHIERQDRDPHCGWVMTLVLVLCPVGCDSASKSAGAIQTDRAAQPGVPAPHRTGVATPVIWRDTPAAPQASHGAGASRGRLLVSEVRADRERVYFDVAHQDPTAELHDATSSELFVRVNRCRALTLRPSGAVWRNWQTPSTVSTALTSLPDGELEVTLRAFDVERNWLFRKEGTELRALRREERAGAVRVPADPEHGLPERTAIVIAQACPEEVMLP